MTLSQLFARRYLFSPKSHSVINLIAGVSVVAVAMPVAAMIILLSVFNGFEQLARSMCATFDADLTVMPVRGQTFDAAAIDTAAVAALPEVAALTLVAEQSVLLEHGERQVIARVRGVDDRYGEVFPVAASVTAGRYEVRLGDLDRVVLGQGMAYDLGVRSLADTRIGIYAIRRGSFSSLLPLDGYTRRTVPVSGLYSLDAETESRYALTSLRLAQELFGYDGRATGLLVRLRDGADARAVVPAVERLADEAFAVRTREQMNPSFYRIVAYEKWGVFFISLLVLVVASFSVVGALSMLMIDKRDDVRTLRALGADTSLIRRIFIREGLLIGGLGAVTEETVENMRRLIGVADVIVPNLTEAEFLTERYRGAEALDRHQAREVVDALLACGPRSVVITSGLEAETGRHGVWGYCHRQGRYFTLPFDFIQVHFPGTGDVFSAVLIGELLAGTGLEQAARKAMDTVERLVCLDRNEVEKNKGIRIERFLDLLRE